jgi:hypothetical protein
MDHRSGLTVLACLALVLPAQAEDLRQAPKVLDGAALISLFEGRGVTGVYADGTAVKETYRQGGSIDYWDEFRTAKGTWSVVNNLLCTFYDDIEMSGGCFRVEQLSANCFDYMALASSPGEALAPMDKPRYTARAHVDGLPDTCPDELAA